MFFRPLAKFLLILYMKLHSVYTKKKISFHTKEECEAAIKVYQQKRYKKAFAESILDCIILQSLASNTFETEVDSS